jgi:hypothetical protein
LFAKAKKKKDSQVVNLYPKLKQRQRALHTLRALIRLIKLAIFCTIFYGLYLLWNMNFWLVESVELNGLSNTGYHYVSKFSLEKKFIGQNILEVNPAKVNNILQNIRLFKEIKAYRTIFPAILTINFVERTPYLTVYEEASNQDIIIDEEGVALISTQNINKEVKQVYTLKKIINYKITPEQLNAIKVIEKLRNYKKIDDLGAYDLSNPKNIVLNTPENHILLGNLEDFVTKIKTVPVIESLSKTNKNELEYIDIRYWRNPVLKLRKGSDSYEKK